MIKKIVITGPESSGKTTLAKQLAKELNTIWVPEFARQYIEGLDREYEEKDLLKIAKGQIAFEEICVKKANRFLICDTDLITIKVWAEIKYQKCDDFILKNIENRPYDYYLLCSPEIPWEFDPQRENPNDRATLFERYKNELEYYQKPFSVLFGNKKERLFQAIKYIKANLSD